MKSVLLLLSSDDMSRSERDSIYRLKSKKLRKAMTDPVHDTSLHRNYIHYGRSLHTAYKHCLRQVCWPRKVDLVLEYLALDKLEINCAFSSCVGSCCDSKCSALSTLRAGFAHGMPLELKIIGASAQKIKTFIGMMARGTEHRKQTSTSPGDELKVSSRILCWVEVEDMDNGRWPLGEDELGSEYLGY